VAHIHWYVGTYVQHHIGKSLGTPLEDKKKGYTRTNRAPSHGSPHVWL